MHFFNVHSLASTLLHMMKILSLFQDLKAHWLSSCWKKQRLCMPKWVWSSAVFVSSFLRNDFMVFFCTPLTSTSIFIFRSFFLIHNVIIGQVRRYQAPDEHPFFPEDLSQPILPSLPKSRVRTCLHSLLQLRFCLKKRFRHSRIFWSVKFL